MKALVFTEKNKISYLFGIRVEESQTIVKQLESNSNSIKKYNERNTKN